MFDTFYKTFCNYYWFLWIGLLTFHFRNPKGSQKIFLGSSFVTDWLPVNNWLISCRVTNWLTYWLAQLPEWMIDWLIDWMTEYYQLIGWLTGWLTDWLTGGWLADWLTDFSAHQLTDQLTGGLVNYWLADCVTDRLLDWLVSSLSNWLDWLADVLRFMLRKCINNVN